MMTSRENVGAGWQPILDRLEAALQETVPGYQVVQIKEKFGGLRYYVDLGDVSEDAWNEAYRLIGEAEDESFRTCEMCGGPGKPEGRWIRTLCDPCREEAARKRRALLNGEQV